MRKEIILLVVLSSCCIASPNMPCTVRLERVSELPAQTPISISKLEFRILEEQMTSTIRVDNIGLTPVNAAFAIIDFYKSERYLFSMTYWAATSEEALHPSASFSPIFTSPWPMSRSLLPGEPYTVSADSSLRLSDCPETARIGLLLVAVSKGQPFEYNAAG